MATAIDPASALTASGLNLNDLLQVLLTELTHQDPFKPVDNKDFMAQIAQFASLDSTQQLNQNVSQLLSLQALSQSVGLIGRTVSATSGGETITGRVTALTLTDGIPRLTVTSNGDGRVFPNITIGDLQTVRP
jgi:flagellar basal-body rod modification protein FlgD